MFVIILFVVRNLCIMSYNEQFSKKNERNFLILCVSNELNRQVQIIKSEKLLD